MSKILLLLIWMINPYEGQASQPHKNSDSRIIKDLSYHKRSVEIFNYNK